MIIKLLLVSILLFGGGVIMSPVGLAASNDIEVHGHRGSRGTHPENTIPAFNAAIEAGVDYLEMDLGVSKDGILIVSHDPHITPERCRYEDGTPFSESILIHSLTLDQIKKFDCGSLKNSRFPEQKQISGVSIPTLSEVFDAVKRSKNPNAKRVKFNIETKIFPDHPEYTVGPKEFAQRFLEVVKSAGLLDRVVLQSFDPRTLVSAKEMEPRIVTSFLVEDGSVNLVESAKKYGAQIISPDFELLTKEKVELLHSAGIRVIPWTVNQTKDWAKTIEMGVDGIITDYPKRLVDFIKKN